MSNFEKVMVTVVGDKMKPIDFTNLTGYVGCYTFDPDYPTSGEFYVMFDDTIRNKYSMDLAVRMSESKNVKRQYVKIINNKPYYIYAFWLTEKLKDQIHSGVVSITDDIKIKCFNFWSHYDSLSLKILHGMTTVTSEQKHMPCEDYNTSSSEYGLIIQKKGDTLQQKSVPLFYFT